VHVKDLVDEPRRTDSQVFCERTRTWTDVEFGQRCFVYISCKGHTRTRKSAWKNLLQSRHLLGPRQASSVVFLFLPY